MRRVWLVGFRDNYGNVAQVFAVFSSYKRAAAYADEIDALPHVGEWLGVGVFAARVNQPTEGVEDAEADIIREMAGLDYAED